MATDNFEARENVLDTLANVLFQLSDPEDMKGEEDIAMDEYRAILSIMLGAIDFNVTGVAEDGTISASIKILDLEDYLENILSE